jgi:chromate reductase, NAD(P)H dehydrogenase (quinone)
MFVVVSGTNRRFSVTARISALCAQHLRDQGHEVELIDLLELSSDVLDPDAYFKRPACMAPYQAAIDRAEGLITVVPEYNGSFPGVLKLWIDLLEFPRTFFNLPCAFVGLAAGNWGGLRSVEQLEQVYGYRNALAYNQRTFIPAVHDVLDEEHQFKNEVVKERLVTQLDGFVEFARRNPRPAAEQGAS